MPFKIAFVDPARGDYTPETPRHRPLGGSQSALCYLAHALAAAGLSVTLVNGTRTPGLVHGVHCRSMASVSLDDLGGFDAVVLLNGCAPDLPARLRAVLGSAGKLILWMQHAVDEPAAEMLADPRARACWDGFAFVSLWQMETYLAAFELDRSRCRVLRNGIAPAFAGLFPAGIDIAATKPWPPVLAYTSAPFRGLDVLLDSVARIRADIPGTTLRVFSSLEGYQVPADQDPYRDLYRRCRETEGVEYVGAVSQDALAHALREATALAYLNRFAETSCIAVMEALAAGCLVLSSRLGALPETGAGFARLIPVPADAAEHARRFAEVARTALAEQRADPAAADRRLRAQVDHVNARMTWTVAARAWREWLGEPRREAPSTLARAESCLAQADHDEARELCRLVLAVTPTHGAAWRLLSQSLTAGARYTDAGRALVRAGTTGGPPPFPPPFPQGLAMGLVQGDDGRPVGERIAVIEALAQEPLPGREALAAMAGRLASEALLAGDFSAALQAYGLRLALRPGDARTRLATAWPLTRLGRHDEAMAAIERALSEDAGILLANREAMALVASCVEEAETAVHGAVAGPGPGSGGGDAGAAARLFGARAGAVVGRRRYRQGRLAEAMEALRPAAALGIDPEAQRLLIAAGVALAQRNLLDALKTHLDAGAREGADRLADAGWQGEARAMIALVEDTLRLDHDDEDRRTATWTALRGFDAWLAYTTTVPHLPPPAPLPPGGRRVYDCFPFYNELDLLDVRLAELGPVVDRFVLVEATFTHAGRPKPLYYEENRARFAAYADKIVHVVVDDDPGGFAWRREAHQRDAIARGLGGCAPSDMILISDADEILRAGVVERLRREPDDGPTLFAPHIDIFLYFLDRKAPEPWVSVAAAPWELIRRIGPNRARYLTKQGIGRTIADAGWHFTWMGGHERFRAKLEAYAHREMIAGFDRDAAGNQARLERFYATGRLDGGAVPGMWTGLVPCPVGDRHPAGIRDNLAHFRRLGWLAPEPEPDPAALVEAGRGYRAAGRTQRAEAAFRAAAALDPACIDAFDALSDTAAERQAPAEAVGPLRRCIALDALGTFHRFKLASVLLMERRHAEAAATLRDLIRRDPENHRAHANLGVALKNLGRHGEAVAAGRRSLALVPAEHGVLSNVGLALSLQIGREEEAARLLARAVALAPDFTDARFNLALVLRGLHRVEEAQAQCRRIIDRKPDHAEAHTLLGTCLLLRGELEEGFREYEWRTRLADGRVAPRGLPSPLWVGGDPRGRTIVLHDEQGLGDGIQFVRYAPLLQHRGARVIVECNDPLVRLFAGLSGVDGVVGRSSPPPPHDAHAPLLSLPHRLGTTMATIPADIPYLRAEPALVADWAERLGACLGPRGRGLRVGLVWAGNPDFRDDVRRSPGLEALLPLFDVAGVAIVALQKGAGRGDLDRLRHRLPDSFVDIGAQAGDFADTAAIMENLDLVISSCTAPAHLAGALGRPVWTILPAVCDWRWFDRGATSPWYPTMRLFRQRRAGEWAPVVAEVRAALARAAAP